MNTMKFMDRTLLKVLMIPSLYGSILLLSFPYDLHSQSSLVNNEVEIMVLGTAQDAGAPQIGCTKSCCVNLISSESSNYWVSSLGLILHKKQETYLFDATPDIGQQIAYLNQFVPFKKDTLLPNGIFLTHAHIGHYTGLMYLGREAYGAKNIAVYSMPKMATFLASNGPWEQLVQLNNISIKPLTDQSSIQIAENVRVKSFTVPHRDEYSETVGYQIEGPSKKALFIPDIDKWERWNQSIDSLVQAVDFAFIDATFYDQSEIPNRDMSEIPHPFIVESMNRFEALSKELRSRIYFIHMNHTNPALKTDSEATQEIINRGFKIARKGMKFSL